RGPGGIQERTQKVENRALPAFGAKLSRRSDVSESRMIIWREKKGEPMLSQRQGGFVWREIDPDTQRLENIGTTGLRSDGAIAVLGHRYASRRHNKRHGRRDIERVEPITTCSANIQYLAGTSFRVERRLDRPGPEFAGESGDFFSRFAFPRKRRQEICFEFRQYAFVDEFN